MHNPTADLLIKDASQVITCAAAAGDGIGKIDDASIAVADGKILAVGTARAVAAQVDATRARVIDARGKVAAPGFVDCHTHLVFGRSRVREYALRMTHSATEMAALDMPTGIPASVTMTREASEDALFASALERLGRMLAGGTTTVESKSGYGLSLEHELKQLRVNRRLAGAQPVDIVSTFLGGHDFPPEVDRRAPAQRRRYIDQLVGEMLPAVTAQGLAEFIDVYCDDGYFTVEEGRRILTAGQRAGLHAKIHTDAYACIGASAMAAEIQAVSADHLNYTTPDEMERLAAADVVGVVLPALDFAVAHPAPFNPRAMIARGMTLALGTNLNPGNWTESMQFVLVLACRVHRMSPEEAIRAATLGAARALKRAERVGSLEKGKAADIQIWDLPTYEDVIYRLGSNAVETVIKNGEICFSRAPADQRGANPNGSRHRSTQPHISTHPIR